MLTYWGWQRWIVNFVCEICFNVVYYNFRTMETLTFLLILVYSPNLNHIVKILVFILNLWTQITTTMNKVFQCITWNRMEKWLNSRLCVCVCVCVCVFDIYGFLFLDYKNTIKHYRRQKICKMGARWFWFTNCKSRSPPLWIYTKVGDIQVIK